MTIEKQVDEFDAYFRSANGVPPNERISVPTAEWKALLAALNDRENTRLQELRAYELTVSNLRAKVEGAQSGEQAAERSDTYGMNIWQRILHVGGRENAQTYIEFGSVEAVRALVRQVLRDLPDGCPDVPATSPATNPALEVSAVREACAKMCDARAESLQQGNMFTAANEAFKCAAAIRQHPAFEHHLIAASQPNGEV